MVTNRHSSTTEADKVLQKAGQIASSKSYYRNSLKEVIELKISILNGKDPEKNSY